MRRAAGTAAVVAVLAAAVPAARADAAPPRWRLWRVQRVDGAARPLGVDVAVTATAADALALLVGTRGTGTGRRVVTSLFWEVGGTAPAVYRNGASVTSCPPGGCAEAGGDEAHFRVGNDQPVREDYLILTWGASARTTFDRPGWRVREVRAPRVHRIDLRDAGGTGATAQGQAVEQYEGTAPSSAVTGSLAWASIPCDGGGSGEAALSSTPAVGTPRPLACLDGRTETAAVAPRAVRWAVTGRVVGVAENAPVTRLLVFNAPAA